MTRQQTYTYTTLQLLIQMLYLKQVTYIVRIYSNVQIAIRIK